ncbi:hypothetical protein TH44_08195 [Thalassospira xiamenensis]|uniref:Uncharacterized protein n=1 Tax=Thalassospira xiamenensis TaxID=220697 RepID=A0A367XCW1_9PROT|nr:hypothetical protein TH44_08195 [Thalassospira xiamenensis]
MIGDAILGLLGGHSVGQSLDQADSTLDQPGVATPVRHDTNPNLAEYGWPLLPGIYGGNCYRRKAAAKPRYGLHAT